MDTLPPNSPILAPLDTPSSNASIAPRPGNGKRAALAIALAIFAIGGASAAYLLWGKGNAVSVDLEAQLPSQAAWVVTLDLEGSATRRHLPDLLSAFGKTDARQRLEDGLRLLTEQTGESGIEKELASLLSSVRQAALSFVDGDAGGTYGIATIRDRSSYTTLSAKLATMPGYARSDIAGVPTVGKADGGPYVAERNGVVYLSDSAENLSKLLSNGFASASLATDSNYLATRQRLPEGFVRVYLRPSFLTAAIEAGAAEGLDEATRQQMEQANKSLQAIASMGFALGAESDGIRITGATMGNREVLDRAAVRLDASPSQKSYLAQDVPASRTLFYSEAYALRDSLSESFRLNGTDPAALREQFALLLQEWKLDLDKDVAPLFAKGTAIALQFDEGNVFPALTLITDATGNEPAAERVLSALDTAISGFVSSLTAPESGIPAGLISKTTVPVGDRNFTRVRFNTAALSAFVGPEAPAELRDTLDKLQIELTMGLSANGKLIVTTASGFDKRFGQKGLAGEEAYSAAMERVTDHGRGIAYASPSALSEYLSKVYSVLSAYEGGSADDSFSQALQILKPLSSLALSSSAQAYESGTDGFLTVQR